MRTRGEGVKKSQNFAEVIYGWPLKDTMCTVSHLVQLGREGREAAAAAVVLGGGLGGRGGQRLDALGQGAHAAKLRSK